VDRPGQETVRNTLELLLETIESRTPLDTEKVLGRKETISPKSNTQKNSFKKEDKNYLIFRQREVEKIVTGSHAIQEMKNVLHGEGK
jgi:hypothetical protein